MSGKTQNTDMYSDRERKYTSLGQPVAVSWFAMSMVRALIGSFVVKRGVPCSGRSSSRFGSAFSPVNLCLCYGVAQLLLIAVVFVDAVAPVLLYCSL